MANSRAEILACVIDVLQGYVTDQGTPINEGTDPIRGLGLVSDDGLDFACEVSSRLGFHFPDDLNPFVDDSGQRARRVGEIADLIATMTKVAEEAHSG